MQHLVLTACALSATLTFRRILLYRDRLLRLSVPLSARTWVCTLVWALLLCAQPVFYSNQRSAKSVLLLLVECALLPAIAAIDSTVRLVPTVLVRMCLAIFAAILVGQHSPGLAMRCLGQTFQYVLLLWGTNRLIRNSIGAGDIRFGLVIGPLSAISGTPGGVAQLLVVTCVLTLLVEMSNVAILHREPRSFPLVPYLTAAFFILEICGTFIHGSNGPAMSR